MENELLTRIKSQKYFYRDNYYRACNALWGAIIVILVLAVVITYLYVRRPLPDFYATSMNGTLTRIISMAAPNYSHTPLIQ